MKPFRLLALLLLACLVFSGSAKAAGQLRIAYQPTPLYAPLFVAKAKGWVEEELAKANSGVTVQVKWASFAAGPAMNESFAADQQDIGFMGDTPALIGKSVGIDTRVVGISVSGPQGLGVLVAMNAPFLSPKDLKGRKVAVTKGSYAQHFLDLVLEKAGLAPGDIELINMPPSDIPPAIISGAIAAGATWEPYITRYENEKAVRVLVDATGLEKGVQPIIASGNAVKNKRLLVEAVLRAYGRGADFIRSNPNEAAMLAAKDSSMPPDLLEKVFAKQDFAPALSDEDISEFKKTETYMRKINLLRKDVDVDDWVDRSFVNAGKVR